MFDEPGDRGADAASRGRPRARTVTVPPSGVQDTQLSLNPFAGRTADVGLSCRVVHLSTTFCPRAPACATPAHSAPACDGFAQRDLGRLDELRFRLGGVCPPLAGDARMLRASCALPATAHASTRWQDDRCPPFRGAIVGLADRQVVRGVLDVPRSRTVARLAALGGRRRPRMRHPPVGGLRQRLVHAFVAPETGVAADELGGWRRRRYGCGGTLVRRQEAPTAVPGGGCSGRSAGSGRQRDAIISESPSTSSQNGIGSWLYYSEGVAQRTPVRSRRRCGLRSRTAEAARRVDVAQVIGIGLHVTLIDGKLCATTRLGP